MFTLPLMNTVFAAFSWFPHKDGAPRPFPGYTLASRPADAKQMCARVANEDHSIIPASGNYVDLTPNP
jgi:hypothetical protein